VTYEIDYSHPWVGAVGFRLDPPVSAWSTSSLIGARERDAIEALEPIAHPAETVPVGGQNAA
jgi:hypothetical protein